MHGCYLTIRPICHPSQVRLTMLQFLQFQNYADESAAVSVSDYAALFLYTEAGTHGIDEVLQ